MSPTLGNRTDADRRHRPRHTDSLHKRMPLRDDQDRPRIQARLPAERHQRAFLDRLPFGSMDRIEAHVALFNAAVRSGDWSAFVATFAPDATMGFVGVPAGPFRGRDAIAQATRHSHPMTR